MPPDDPDRTIPTPDSEQPTRADSTTTSGTDRIGPYRILEKIGEGGFGEVYAAEQTAPVKRRVALKILKAGMDTKEVLARFEAERQALAMMDHPNIARVLDAGETEKGRSYFVMDLVKGEPITKYCDRHTLSTEERLSLFIPVCHAVQHAHQKGIIHRDLKPANILVALSDGKPMPRVIDFGIAKATTGTLTGKTLYTQQGQLIGTPEYMSPEQAEMGGLDVDTTTDVYSLGVVLYELLTGALPFDSATLRTKSYAEIQRILREEEPPKPSSKVSTRSAESKDVAKFHHTDARTLTRLLQGELDWIVLKAMEKDRTRRYATANSLAMDVQHYLSDEPVIAGPPSAVYKARKFAKRNRVAIGVVAAILITVTGALVQSMVQNAKIEAARDESEAVTEFLAEMLASVDPGEQGRDVTVKEVLDEAAKTIGEKFGAQPLVEARLRHTMGRTYNALGGYEVAEEHLNRAVEIRRRELGGESVETLRSISSLARIISNVGRTNESVALLLQLLEVQRRVLGEEHRETLKSLGRLASVYRIQGESAKAESLFAHTLAAQRRALGDQDPETLQSMGELARLYLIQGRLKKSESLFRTLLENRRRTLGEEHPGTLFAQHYVAYLHVANQRYEQAESLFVSTIEAERRVLGYEHPRTLESMRILAGMYEAQGRTDEAESLLRPLLEIQRRLRGKGHVDTLLTMDILLKLYNSSGRTSEARELALELLALRRQAAEGPNVDAQSKNLYAWLLLTCEPSDLQHPQEAVRIALAANDQTGFSDHNLLDTLALAYHRTGQRARAIEMQAKAIALLRQESSNTTLLAQYEERLAEFEAAAEGGR